MVSEMAEVEIPTELYEFLGAVATKRGMTVDEWISFAIRRYMAKVEA